jgi:hypothetical protein
MHERRMREIEAKVVYLEGDFGDFVDPFSRWFIKD